MILGFCDIAASRISLPCSKVRIPELNLPVVSLPNLPVVSLPILSKPAFGSDTCYYTNITIYVKNVLTIPPVG